MGEKRLISKEIEEFYNEVSEEERLSTGLGKLEFTRNKELIEKFISSAKATVIDVGGGTGKYAEWLAEKGHNVFLVDPVSKHINEAKKKADKLENSFGVRMGEARNLNLSDAFADMVILHGPLYHLQKKSQRQKAILEAKRVLKPQGIILGFAINYTASLLVGLLQGFIHDDHFFEMCKQELNTGIHEPPESLPELFTNAYYHRPEELKEEFLSAGLEYINTFAVEGSAWLDNDYFVTMADKKKKERLFNLIRMTETDSNLHSISPHMMIATRKTS